MNHLPKVCLLAVLLAAPVQALELPWPQAMTRPGLSLRIDFGAGPAGRASLALTSTGDFARRRVTWPVLALDFGARRPMLGTILAVPLDREALRHPLRLRRLPPAAAPRR